MRRYPRAGLTALALLLLAAPAAAWTPGTHRVIAREAARLAPPDLARQIDRHERELLAGAVAPFEDSDPERHFADPGGGGRLEETIVQEIDAAVEAIRSHRPFAEIVHRLGRVSHYVADANNPLSTSAADPREAAYFADYLLYLEQAEPRLPLVFYGLSPRLDGRRSVPAWIAATLERGRELYPLVGREYRRIGFDSGRRRFDDRSTAFGVASLAFSHAVTDVSQALRHVWIEAGGADPRTDLPRRGGPLLRLPRRDPAP